ncbi:MAG TPA: extracellular solute-binding protein, partial [Chloroflexota bacterium]|nr:extracellular solute-binding protein [Chloroflexota bacterium]
KNPDSPLAINMRNVSSQSYREQILTQLAGGVGPDVFRLGWADVFPFMEQGQIIELDPLFAKHPNSWMRRPDLKKWILDGARYRGKLYGTPMGGDMSSIFLNKSLFEKTGTPPPPESYKEEKYNSGWTWDHVLETAKKLTVRKGDGPPDQYGIDAIYNNTPSLVESFGGRTMSENSDEFFWHEEPATRGLQWMADLRLKEKVAASAAEAQGGAFSFINGRLAMSWTFVSQLTYRTTDVKDKFNWDQAPWPHAPGQKPKVMFWYSAWALNAKGTKRDDAFEWLHFVSGPEGTVPGIELGWELPLFKDLDPQYNKRIAEWKKNISPALEGLDVAITRHYYHHPRWSEAWRTFINPALDEILVGKKTAAAAMKEIKPEVDKLFKEGAALMK